MEFKDLIFKPHNSVRSEMYESLGFSDNQFHSKYTFDNGVSISILKGDMFYSNGVDTFEVAVIGDDNNMTREYFDDTEVDDDVRGHLTESEVMGIVKNIENKA